MRVLLKLELDCTADAAWRAIRSPAVLREVVAPWLDLTSLEPGGLPTVWPEGTHRLRALAFRRFPAGDEHVDVSYPGGLPIDVRMLRDAGGALTGPLAMFDRWDHRMAVSPLPGGRTLYRDQLLAHAGRVRPRRVVSHVGVLAVAGRPPEAARARMVVRSARHG